MGNFTFLSQSYISLVPISLKKLVLVLALVSPAKDYINISFL